MNYVINHYKYNNLMENQPKIRKFKIINEFSIVRNDVTNKFIKFIPENDAKILEKTIYDLSCEKNSNMNNEFKCTIDNKLKIYKCISNDILCNLDPNNAIGNTYLLPKVLDKSISIEKLVHLKPHEMFPDRWKVYVNREKHELKSLTSKPLGITSAYKCYKCGRNQCTYFERQDRCMDEPMTIHITCTYCGNKWKI